MRAGLVAVGWALRLAVLVIAYVVVGLLAVALWRLDALEDWGR